MGRLAAPRSSERGMRCPREACEGLRCKGPLLLRLRRTFGDGSENQKEFYFHKTLRHWIGCATELRRDGPDGQASAGRGQKMQQMPV